MPNTDGPLPSILFQRVKDDGEEIDWSKFLSGSYELTQILGGMEMEAGQKGRVIVVTAVLVPADDFFADEPEDDADLAGGDDAGQLPEEA